MSLHTLANHLQTAGRGDDKMLVHMTPNEVNGLQSLAMAHGGSLTINPETGLPEAGFLSKILPMVAGLALGPAGFGLMSAASAGLLVGGATAVATGSLKNGLLAGLGAYGGAGLGAGLGAGAAAAGAASAAAPAMISAGAMPGVVGGMGALAPAAGAAGAGTLAAGAASAVPPGLAAATNPALLGNTVPVASAAPVAPPVYGSAPSFNAGVPQPTDLNALAQQRAFAQQAAQVSPSAAIEQAAKSKGIFGGMDFSKLMNPEFMKENKGNYLAAMAPLLMEEERRKQQAEQAAAPAYYGMSRVVNPSARAPGSTAERTYFADGGLTNLPVENMSQQNTVGANTNYPMANIKPYGYSVPKNNPISQNVFQPDGYQNTDPYTGEQKLASGGIIALKSGGKAPAPKSEAQINEENAAKEYAAYLKDRNADKAKAKAESDARIRELNKEYADRIGSFGKDTGKELKERQASIKAEKDKAAKAEMQKELNSWQQGRNSELANLKTEQANAIKDRTGEYTNRVKELDSEIKERQALRNFDTDVFKKGYTGFSGDIKGDDLTALNKGYDTEIGKQKSEAEKAKQSLEAAKKTGIQSLISRAQDTYNQQQGEYDEATKAKDSRITQFREETKRGSGLQARAFDASSPANTAAIEKKIKDIKANPTDMGGGFGQRTLSSSQKDELSALEKELAGAKSGQVLDPATGKMVADKTPKSYQKLSKVPGLDGTVKILEEKDIRTVFEEMTGRAPTKAEMDKYLGGKSSQAALAKALTDPKKGLAELQMAQKFTDDDLNQQAVYYWGREMTPGELKYFKNPANKVSNFNVLRNMLTSDSKYLENLNKVNQAAFTSAQKAIQAETEGRASKQDIASYYQQVFNKPPSPEELDKFYNTGLNISALKEQIASSPEYEKTLTQSFVPSIVPSGTQSLVPGIAQDVSPYVMPTLKQATPMLQDLPISQQTSGVYKYDPFAVTPKMTTENPTIPYADVSQKLGLIDLYSQLGQPSLTPQKTNYGVPTAQSGLTAPQENIFGFSQYPPGVEQAIKAYAAQQAAQQAQTAQQAPTGMASGGVAGYNLGGYSDGGRLLRGPGDGVSDSIPASIGDRQPARLADGEFVVPARIVSELGNGSTEAGARKLYAMMERVQRARSKTVGRGKVAVNSRSEKMLPA